ncbi:leucine-rich repeat and fibronectin type III domain-containing protein 1-like protein [Limulus polyphemus]|uniref:Leucine-rich repeat and fibronectin type III domain-containing protein 1-like protein n=1 Tax=Limulus polyphemus TaxID=6850 RepID=A0ABM1B508_LIMPO|nr:leucine-rich repeat and fibronectin type III domain-containing protein 1-like protein [Limulus polyphemus]
MIVVNFVLLIFLCGSVWMKKCLPAEEIFPCVCQEEPNEENLSNILLKCFQISDEQVLEEVIGKFRGLSIYELKIEKSSLPYLPHGLLSNISLSKFILSETTLPALIPPIPGPSPFQGLDKVLNLFQVSQCVGLNGWELGALGNLQNLESFIVKDSDLHFVTDKFNQFLTKKMIFFTISNNKIKYIDDKAFTNLMGIEIFDISGNGISELKRSMFPRPASKLNFLNLAVNNLQMLPEDFFEDMPSLKFLLLQENKLQTLPSEPFKILFENYGNFFFSGNPIVCDCRLRWITMMVPRPKINMKCAWPPDLMDVSFNEIETQQLVCRL